MDAAGFGELIGKLLTDHGLATVLVLAVMFGIHKWATKIFDWYTTVKWPAEREDRQNKLEADHDYRLQNNSNIKTVSDAVNGHSMAVNENTKQTERNAAEVAKMRKTLESKGVVINEG